MRDQQNIFDRNLLRLKRFSLEHVFGGNLFDRNTARSTHFRLNHFAIDDVKKKPRITQEVLLFDRTSILTSIEAKPKWNRRLHQIELEMGWNQTNVKIKCEIEIEANQIGIEI